MEDALERLGLEHDVLDEVVGQVGQVDLADALGELNLEESDRISIRDVQGGPTGFYSGNLSTERDGLSFARSQR